MQPVANRCSPVLHKIHKLEFFFSLLVLILLNSFKEIRSDTVSRVKRMLIEHWQLVARSIPCVVTLWVA